MKANALIASILVSTLILLLMSMTTQATEYKEIKAEDISTSIEKGEDVHLENYRIIGDLNVSQMKLKTVPNPYIIKNQNDPILPLDLIKNSSVIESNITIKNSIFENELYFASAIFNGSVDFSMTTFNNSTCFPITNFNSSVNFSDTTFNEFIFFSEASFYNYTDFSRASFNNSTYFSAANFYGPVTFNKVNFKGDTSFDAANFYNSTDVDWTNFYGSADFLYMNCYEPIKFEFMNFYGPADFSGTYFYNYTRFAGTNFHNSANFFEARFYNPAYFYNTTFNDSATFKGPDMSENILTMDGKTCKLFTEYYNDEARYADADNIYFNHRRYAQYNKSIMSFSKWTDIISEIICGYGLRPVRTLYFSAFVILIFSIIYDHGCLCVSVTKGKNNKRTVKFYWPGSAVYRLSNTTREQVMISGWDSLYFSIMTFTTVGSGEWYPKDNYRKWVTLEGLLGWIMLGIFMTTLTNVMIRN